MICSVAFCVQLLQLLDDDGDDHDDDDGDDVHDDAHELLGQSHRLAVEVDDMLDKLVDLQTGTSHNLQVTECPMDLVATWVVPLVVPLAVALAVALVVAFVVPLL